MCVCVCVCERERERERESWGGGGGIRVQQYLLSSVLSSVCAKPFFGQARCTLFIFFEF